LHLLWWDHLTEHPQYKYWQAVGKMIHNKIDITPTKPHYKILRKRRWSYATCTLNRTAREKKIKNPLSNCTTIIPKLWHIIILRLEIKELVSWGRRKTRKRKKGDTYVKLRLLELSGKVSFCVCRHDGDGRKSRDNKARQPQRQQLAAAKDELPQETATRKQREIRRRTQSTKP
jgi:hypothetical protein